MKNECSSFITDELTKVGSDQRSSTIHYDSKSKHSRAYGFVFERHQRSDIFVAKLYGMRTRALGAVHALARARAGPPATAWLLSEYSEAAPQSGQMSCGR